MTKWIDVVAQCFHFIFFIYFLLWISYCLWYEARIDFFDFDLFQWTLLWFFTNGNSIRSLIRLPIKMFLLNTTVHFILFVSSIEPPSEHKSSALIIKEIYYTIFHFILRWIGILCTVLLFIFFKKQHLILVFSKSETELQTLVIFQAI